MKLEGVDMSEHVVQMHLRTDLKFFLPRFPCADFRLNSPFNECFEVHFIFYGIFEGHKLLTEVSCSHGMFIALKVKNLIQKLLFS